MAGTVDKIIPSSRPNQLEQAQIAIDGAERRHRDLRIDNTFTDEHGDDVKLKKGAGVKITVTAEARPSPPQATTIANRFGVRQSGLRFAPRIL